MLKILDICFCRQCVIVTEDHGLNLDLDCCMVFDNWCKVNLRFWNGI